jgi:hypothetical protein
LIASLPLRFALLLAAEPPHEGFDELIAKAEAAFGAKDYDVASRAFADAYALEPVPKYLFARAQAERLAGRCNVAVPLYEQFLASAPSKAEVERARQARARCLEGAGAGDPVGELDGSASPSAADRPPAKPPAPWYRDPVGGALVATGGVAAIIGASVLGFALGKDRRADRAANEGDYVDEKDAAKPPQRAGIAVLSVGGALLVAGAIRWGVLASRQKRRARAAAAVVPGARGVSVTFALRF